MPVQQIECQLTQAQVKRYLAGAEFPEELVRALERHLQACPDCMAEAERQRTAVGGGDAAVVQALAPESGPSALWAKAKALWSARLPREAEGLMDPAGVDAYSEGAWSAFKTPKNLLMSGSLALVLVLMSTAFRNPLALLGPKAAPVAAAKEKAAAEPAPADEETKAKPEADKTDGGPPATRAAQVSEAPVVEGHGSGTEAGTPQDSAVHKPKLPPLDSRSLGGSVVVADGAVPDPSGQPTRKAASKPRSKDVRRKPKTRPAPQSRGVTAHVKVYSPSP